MAPDQQHLIPMPDSWADIHAPYLRYELMYRLKEIIKPNENEYTKDLSLENQISFFFDDMSVYADDNLVGVVFFDAIELQDYNKLKRELFVLYDRGMKNILREESRRIKKLSEKLFSLMRKHGDPQISLPS
jgi:hypothetical protein